MSFPCTLTTDDMDAFDTLDWLPLRQVVRSTHPAANPFSAQGILPTLSRAQRFRVLRHGCGAQILARDRQALAEAQVLLRQACGAAIAFGTATRIA